MSSIMTIVTFVLMIITVFGGVSAQSSNLWEGCIDPQKSRQQNLVTSQQPTRICFMIANSTNWNAPATTTSPATSYLRASFEPKADIYSRFHIPNSYRDLVYNRNRTNGNANSIFRNSSQITISAASQTALSFVRVYYDADKDRVFPYLTVIIDVDRGNVKGITWDDACVFCGATECIENTYNYNGVKQNQTSAKQNTQSCFVSTEDCNSMLSSAANATSNNPTLCDITVYTVWTGTDRNGIALQSQSYRFSEFPPQELADRITQLLIPDAAVDLIQDTNDNDNSDNTNNTNNTNNTANRVLHTTSNLEAVIATHEIIEDHYRAASVASTSTKTLLSSSVVITEDGDL